MKRWFVFILVQLFFSCMMFSQRYHYDYGFERNQQVPVLTANGDTLLFPWAGGMNTVRFSEVDIDRDGIKDMIAFEKHGNRILPFLYNNYNGRYEYAPQYVPHFPYLHDWVILKDYNGDGKEDIFTYGLAGIKVYKNVSGAQLAFELQTEQLQSLYYQNYTNIYASPDDYLAIEDMDNDGDLDILNFWVLGKYVHYQRNYAVEQGLPSDTFDFRLESECWGHFSEGADNNAITLNTDCEAKNCKDEPTRHVGSSLFAHDFSANGLKDLLLGDVDYDNLLFLRNGGNTAEARITSMDTLFPDAQTPIRLVSMPAVSLIDIDHDNSYALLASPSDPSLTKSQDLNSVWRYDYDSLLHNFTLRSTSFLQNEMIDVGSGAYPLLYDYDGDGLPDLFVANYGSFDSSSLVNGFRNSYFSSSVAYYHNVGSSSFPSFRLVTSDFNNMKQYNRQALFPAIGDIDGDGVPDIVLGGADGKVGFCSTGSFPTQWTIDVGDYATPFLYDIDNDSKPDLLIGNRRGFIAYYRNVSSVGNIAFELVTNQLGDVDVRDYSLSYFGFSVPCFFKNNEGETVLFCANEQGQIHYYNNIDNNLTGTFSHIQNNLAEFVNGMSVDIREGIRCGVAVGDLNNDGFPDMVVGNYAGGLSFYQGITPPPVSIASNTSIPSSFSFFPNPTSDFVTVCFSKKCFSDVCLYNMMGQVVGRWNVANADKLTIDVAAFRSGIYFITALVNGVAETKKMVVVH